MEPVTTVTAAWTIAKTAGEISTKLYEFGKGLKDREAKQQVEKMLDNLSELKHSASKLEDENHSLREQLRFRGDEYEFRTPFRYHKARPNQALCVKCFSENKESPMGEIGMGCTSVQRSCLVCGQRVQVTPYSNQRAW